MRDPVCEMTVCEGVRLTVDGYPEYGFCSQHCREAFLAETATLRIDGKERTLDSPRLVSQGEALDALVSDERPADFTKAEDFVLMDHRT